MTPKPITKPRCIHCRRKKIKCDYGQPMCGKCVRSGLRCVYYKDTIFVNYAGDENGSSSSQANYKIGNGSDSTQAPSAAGGILMAPNPGPGHRRHIFDHFLGWYLPDSTNPQAHGITWIFSVPCAQGGCPPLDMAANALGTAVLGRVNGDHHLTSDAGRMYGAALSGLKHWLFSKSQRNRLHESLLAVMVLQLFETVECSLANARSWLGHTAGVSAILYLSGPEAFQHGALHKAFLCCRVSMIVLSLLHEQPTYLASDAWRAIPWNGQRKDDLHLLIDILAEIPNFLSLSNTITTNSRKGLPTTNGIGRFQQHRQELDAALDIWLADLVKTRQGSPASYFAAEHGHDQSPFSRWIGFKCLADAQIMLFYWMAKLMLFHGSVRVQRYLECQGFVQRVIDKRETINVTRYADSICQSMAWCLSSATGVLGLQLSTLPLRVATQFYQSCNLIEREHWCTRIITTTMQQHFALVAG